MARAMYDVMTTDLRPGLASVGTPVTVVYARDDAMGMGAGFVQPMYEGNYAALPDKTLVVVDGALHFVMLDQPDAFAAAVERFLK
jgi:pimeloyl-ACP methyl ester carboxylesterase